MIPYLNPGEGLTAARWNDIFSVADDFIAVALGSLSAVFAGNLVNTGFGFKWSGADKQFDRAFFFFDPVTLPSNLHPMAALFLAHYTDNLQSFQSALCLRSYNHAAITTLVNGLTVSSTSSKFGVAKLTKPTWATWAAAIYPGGFGSFSTTGLFSGTVPADNILDVSLGVIKVTVSSVAYAATFKDVTTAEHVQTLKPIDVFVVGNLTWNVAWDKYTLLRIHNCSVIAATITFDSAATTLTTSIPAGGSRCFRKTISGWIACGKYFHWMQPFDGRFLQMRDVSGGTASIFMPGIVGDVLANIMQNYSNLTGIGSGTGFASNLGKYFDPSKFCDLSPIYNNPAYAPTSTEKTPPSGGYFPALADSDVIGDLIVHRGKVLVAATGGTPDHVAFDFTGFAGLAAALNALGVTTRSITVSPVFGPSVTTLEIYGGKHLVDVSCPLVTFITGGSAPLPAAASGTSQATTPKSLVLPVMSLSVRSITDNPTNTTLTFYNWYIDSSGNPATGAAVPVTLNQAGSVALSANTGYANIPFTATVATVENFISSTSGAGGIISAGNFQLLSTPFGHVLTWDEVWPLEPHFNADLLNNFTSFLAPVFIAKVIYEPHVGLHVTRAIFLNETKSYNGFGTGNLTPWEHGVFPPRSPASRFMFWNFPRTDRCYLNQRYFHHDPADAPMMPDWSALPEVGSSQWPGKSFLNPATGSLDELSSNEFIHVAAFYESTPIGADKVLDIGLVFPKTGISRMGSFTAAPDIWTPFANWLNAAGNIIYPVQPDKGGTATLSVPSNWYGLNSGSVLTNANISNPLPNALPCQSEHFNMIASLVNGAPPLKINFTSDYGVSSSGSFIPAYNPIGVPHPDFGGGGDQPTFIPPGPYYSAFKYPNTFFPRGCFYAWTAPASGPDPTATYFAALGITVKNSGNLPDGYAAAYPGLGTEGNPTVLFSTSIARYRWITIDDARIVYNALSVPFVLDAVVVPMAFTAFADYMNLAYAHFAPYQYGNWCSPYSGVSCFFRSTIQTIVAGSFWGVTHVVQGYYPDGSSGWGLDESRNGNFLFQAVCILAENVVDKCVAIIPQNYAYYDASWALANAATVAVLNSTIIPIIVDNTLESAQSEITIVPGTGAIGPAGTPLYETVITTGLANARMVIVPIDGQIQPGNPPPPDGGI